MSSASATAQMTIVSMYAAAGQPPPATPEKVLLRLFVHFHGQRVILLLHGYDKGADDSPRRQQREIAEARKRLCAWKRAESAPATYPERQPQQRHGQHETTGDEPP